MFSFRILDYHTGSQVTNPRTTEDGGEAKRIRRSLSRKAESMNQEYGAYRYGVDFNFVA